VSSHTGLAYTLSLIFGHGHIGKRMTLRPERTPLTRQGYAQLKVGHSPGGASKGGCASTDAIHINLGEYFYNLTVQQYYCCHR